MYATGSQQTKEIINNFLTSLHQIERIPLDCRRRKQALCDYMFLDATVVDAEGVDVATVRAMQDTGALQCSFIETSLVESNSHLINSRKPCKYVITLGDNEANVHVDNQIITNLTLLDAQGKKHLVKQITLLEMPTLTAPIILGFKDIVKLLPQVFISHLVAAMAQAHQEELERLSLATLAPNQFFKTHDAVPRFISRTATSDIIILNINVNGIKSAIKNGLMTYLNNTQHDILTLTEVKLKPLKHAEVLELFNDNGYTATSIYSEHEHGGVMIASKLVEQPVFIHGLPGYDYSDQESRFMIAAYTTFVVGATYVPFNNKETDGRIKYCLKFGTDLRHYIKELLERK